jgi:LmbE family N-acetylglucosaminyl deacetylase
MGSRSLRKIVCTGLIHAFCKKARIKSGCFLNNRPAIVFSPHFDDETLGCGGTIVLKRLAGAHVGIVFMTDGSTSHRNFFPENKLRQMREKEGENAATVLGLNSNDDVVFLNYKEARLFEREADAETKVTELIEKFDPDEIFIPHHREPNLWSMDHLATRRIVRNAIMKFQRSYTIYEYPIWYWFHWPWVGIDFHEEFFSKIILKNTITYRFGMNSIGDFNCGFNVTEVLERKRTALEQHRTQMRRVIENEEWLTLPDISNGQFLACFFTGREFFYRYSTKLKGVY